MSSNDKGRGRSGRVDAGTYLDRRSAIVKRIGNLGRPVRVLLVEDEHLDARKIDASLRVLLGRQVTTEVARTSDEMLKAIKRGFKPDAIILDDRLPPTGGADIAIPKLRAEGFDGRVIIVSGQFDATRRRVLARLDAVGVIDKDDADALALAELFLADPADGT